MEGLVIRQIIDLPGVSPLFPACVSCPRHARYSDLTRMLRRVNVPDNGRLRSLLIHPSIIGSRIALVIPSLLRSDEEVNVMDRWAVTCIPLTHLYSPVTPTPLGLSLPVDARKCALN